MTSERTGEHTQTHTLWDDFHVVIHDCSGGYSSNQACEFDGGYSCGFDRRVPCVDERGLRAKCRRYYYYSYVRRFVGNDVTNTSMCTCKLRLTTTGGRCAFWAHTVYSRAFALNGYVRLNGAASDWDRRAAAGCRAMLPPDRRRHRRTPTAGCRRWRAGDSAAASATRRCARAADAFAQETRGSGGERVRPTLRHREPPLSPPPPRLVPNKYATETAHESIFYSTRNPICRSVNPPHGESLR